MGTVIKFADILESNEDDILNFTCLDFDQEIEIDEEVDNQKYQSLLCHFLRCSNHKKDIRLTKREDALIRFIFFFTLNIGKKRLKIHSFNDIANITNIHYPHIHITIKKLEQKNLVFKKIKFKEGSKKNIEYIILALNLETMNSIINNHKSEHKSEFDKDYDPFYE